MHTCIHMQVQEATRAYDDEVRAKQEEYRRLKQGLAAEQPAGEPIDAPGVPKNALSDYGSEAAGLAVGSSTDKPATQATTAEEFNEAAAAQTGWRLLYGDVGLVHHGLVKLIGEIETQAGDDAALTAGMVSEHEEMADTHSWFVPTNYPIRTTSFLEWRVVVDPSEQQLRTIRKRKFGEQQSPLYSNLVDWPMAQGEGQEEHPSSRGLPVSYFNSKWNEVNERLEKETGESPLLSSGFTALRLYTGPMYVKVCADAQLTPRQLRLILSLRLSCSNPNHCAGSTTSFYEGCRQVSAKLLIRCSTSNAASSARAITTGPRYT